VQEHFLDRAELHSDLATCRQIGGDSDVRPGIAFDRLVDALPVREGQHLSAVYKLPPDSQTSVSRRIAAKSSSPTQPAELARDTGRAH
jgi:hypothetical protein